MPASFVKTSDGEKAWKKAKGIVQKEYGAGLEKSNPDRFYSLVTTVYKSVCKSPDYKCGIGEDVSIFYRQIQKLAEALSPFCEGISLKKLREAEQMLGWHEQDAKYLHGEAAKETNKEHSKATLKAAESHEKAAEAFRKVLTSKSAKDLRAAKDARKVALLATRNR
jgi:hypothetical protein